MQVKQPAGPRALGMGSSPRAHIPTRVLQELPFQHMIKRPHKTMEGSLLP